MRRLGVAVCVLLLCIDATRAHAAAGLCLGVSSQLVVASTAVCRRNPPQFRPACTSVTSVLTAETPCTPSVPMSTLGCPGRRCSSAGTGSIHPATYTLVYGLSPTAAMTVYFSFWMVLTLALWLRYNRRVSGGITMARENNGILTDKLISDPAGCRSQCLRYSSQCLLSSVSSQCLRRAGL